MLSQLWRLFGQIDLDRDVFVKHSAMDAFIHNDGAFHWRSASSKEKHGQEKCGQHRFLHRFASLCLVDLNNACMLLRVCKPY